MRDLTKQMKELVDRFLTAAAALMQRETNEKARLAVLAALEGRRSKGASITRTARRKGPIQLCPVPGCKERAAPVFGMVCAKHKDLPKAKIKLYREQRRKRAAAAKKAGRK